MPKTLITQLLEAAPLSEHGFRGTGKDNFEKPEPRASTPARPAVENERTFTVEISLNPGESADGDGRRPSVTFSEPVRMATMTIDHVGTTDSRFVFLAEIEAAVEEICRRHGVKVEISR